jgi:hypothetical protein
MAGHLEESSAMLLVPGESEAILVDDIERGLTREDYDTGYRAWRDHISGFEWCIDTGRFGSLGEPGISDLDCAALVRDGCHLTAIETHTAWRARQSPERKFLFAHEPLLITAAAHPFAPLLHTLQGVRWEGGHGPDPAATSDEQRLFAYLAYALALAPVCARMVVRQKESSLRTFLLLLKSLHMSESFLAKVSGSTVLSNDPLEQSRTLRSEILAGKISDVGLSDTVLGEIRSSIARTSVLLDAYGERLPAVIGDTPESAPPFVLTRAHGRVSAARRTVISAQEDANELHHKVFALAFGQLPSTTPLGKAAADFWQAAARMSEIQDKEKLGEVLHFPPRPFWYRPGIDDAELENREFSCIAMPAAVPHTTEEGGRLSTGRAGHLVHGPYVRIKSKGRYCAELTYLTETCPTGRAGVFEVSVCRIDSRGNHERFETLGLLHLPPTGRARRTARIEFDTAQHDGALLETRVFADAGVRLNAFQIGIWRSTSGPAGVAPEKGARYPWLRFARRTA